jgi:hypothetical protein
MPAGRLQARAEIARISPAILSPDPLLVFMVSKPLLWIIKVSKLVISGLYLRPVAGGPAGNGT